MKRIVGVSTGGGMVGGNDMCQNTLSRKNANLHFFVCIFWVP